MTNIAAIPESQLSKWMQVALKTAWDGVDRGENPFGAAIYGPNHQLIVEACNQAISRTDPTAHAEVMAIADACQKIGCRDLSDHILVATAEPCPMCISAAGLSGIRAIVFGANQSVVVEAGFGSLGISGSDLADRFEDDYELRGEIRSDECEELLIKNRKKSDS